LDYALRAISTGLRAKGLCFLRQDSEKGGDLTHMSQIRHLIWHNLASSVPDWDHGDLEMEK
jgi:hypothetical protein